MKRVIISIVLILGLIVSNEISAQEKSITLEKALSIVQRQYDNYYEVDFYWLSERTEQWGIFVDENRYANWAHDCAIYTFPNTGNLAVDTIPVVQHLNLPPSEEMTSLTHSCGNMVRSGINIPIMSPSSVIESDTIAANRTYAVIINGGYYSYQNFIRYWNDCSLIYQTLTKTYKVPRSNIEVLMADGTDPGNDIKISNGNFISSPLDLDQDGINDIEFSATEENIANALLNFENSLIKGDHLFVFMIGHGVAFNSAESISNLLVWGDNADAIAANRRLFDYELADMLKGIVNNGVIVSVVAGQCYSGGFIDDLEGIGCVVATASAADEPSYAIMGTNTALDLQFDEFLYHWTSAINGADPIGNVIDADADKNGRISMLEAFLYAKEHDQFCQSTASGKIETPQYASSTPSVGEDLAFNHLPKSLDLFIRDRIDDNGVEKIRLQKTFWQSPSIWIRNEDDGEETHENIYWEGNESDAYIYVKVHNRGRDNYLGDTKWLHVNWALASTVTSVGCWQGYETYNGLSSGGNLSPVAIPAIASGDSCIVKIQWSLPIEQLQLDTDTERHHLNVIARITDSSGIDSNEGYLEAQYDVLSVNDCAQKNVAIIKKPQVAKMAKLFIRNIHDEVKSYSLELQPHAGKDTILFSKANVELILSQSLLNSWIAGGSNGDDIVYSATESPLKISLNSANSKIFNIIMYEHQLEMISLKFDFHTPSPSGVTYEFDLIQRDEYGQVVGGQTYIVEAPIGVIVGPGIIDPIVPGEPGIGGVISLGAGLDGSEQLIEWTDGKGIVIGNTTTVEVTPTLTDNTYSLRVLTANGELHNDSITLEPTLGIKSVKATKDEYIVVELLCSTNSRDSYIAILHPYGHNTIRKFDIPPGIKEINLSVSGLPSGLYVIRYIVDGRIVEINKFIK